MRSSTPRARPSPGWPISPSIMATRTGSSSIPTPTPTGPTPALREWVERDLAGAKGATWKFVAFHHPGFNSSRKHFSEQRMRRMAESFEKGGVDLVFSGHVHNYQRTYPLRFVAGKPGKSKSEVSGEWTLDRSYDGKTRTKPRGIIYLVTGAGGANLYDPEQEDDAASWQEFTQVFLSKIHSLTIADVEGSSITIRQVSESGEEARSLHRDQVMDGARPHAPGAVPSSLSCRLHGDP